MTEVGSGGSDAGTEGWLLRSLERVEAEARATGLPVKVEWTGDGTGRPMVVRVRPRPGAEGLEILAARFPEFPASAPGA